MGMYSMYRIATANTYDLTIQNIQQRQSDLSTAQGQLSTGKRVMRASDDAVAATLAEEAQARQVRVQADQRALDASKTALTQADSALGNADTLLQNVNELMVQAGNGSLSAGDRTAIANQLSGLREQLLEVANTKDASGLALFGGLGGANTPFVTTYGPTGAVVSFQGQAGQYSATTKSLPQALDGAAAWMNVPQGNGTFITSVPATNTGQLSTTVGSFTGTTVPAALAPGAAGYQIQFISPTQFNVIDQTTGNPVPLDNGSNGPFTYQPGSTITFGGGVSVALNGSAAAGDVANITPSLGNPGNIFQTIQNVVNALNSNQPNASANLKQEIQRGITEAAAARDSLSVARGKVGDWLNRADTMEGNNTTLVTAYETQQSQLTDLDMVKGITDFQNKQTGLQAALKSYASVQQLSLFQYFNG